jgi:uncharacterized HhH-GPD family protein
MPRLERLDWVVPLSEGKGVTLSVDPAADIFLGENPNALLLGVLYDSQYPTRYAFAAPLRLHDRLGHLDMRKIAAMDEESLMEVFSRKSALHRFPNRYARLTKQIAQILVDQYQADASRIWKDASGPEELGKRIMALPAFGEEKTNWTVGMLGRLGLLPYGGWEEYRVPSTKAKKG